MGRGFLGFECLRFCIIMSMVFDFLAFFFAFFFAFSSSIDTHALPFLFKLIFYNIKRKRSSDSSITFQNHYLKSSIQNMMN